jgi:sn1-specific diacylglycerol lipase
MPSLVLFGHRTLVAGDDIGIFVCFSFLIRVAQLCIAIALVVRLTRAKRAYHTDQSPTIDASCAAAEGTFTSTAYAYVILAVIIAIVGGGIEHMMRVFSGRGTPTQPEKRSMLKPLCHINLTLMVVIRVAMISVGSYLIHLGQRYCGCFQDQERCNAQSNILFGTLLITQLIDVGFNIVATLYFSCKLLPANHQLMNSETSWKVFCRCCCAFTSFFTCCLLGGRDVVNGDFTDVALLLSDFFDFHGTLDLVTSDVVAGLLMVKRVQWEFVNDCRQLLSERAKEIQQRDESVRGDEENGRDSFDIVAKEVTKQGKSLSDVTFQLKRYMGSHCQWVPTVTKLLTKDDPIDVLTIAEGAHFMRLALAIYTWIMFSIKRPSTGFCEMSYLSMKEVCKNGSKPFAGDSKFCRLHAVAFMKQAGIEETEIAYAQFNCRITGDTPYAIVIDHDWKSIVIVIRGTESLEDALKDLTVRPTSLKETGDKCGFDGTDIYAHSGILESTTWIYEDIKKHGVIDKLLLDKKSKFTNYRLRITGHSLGAGCAAILSLMLRPTHPNLRCHCFCPPGCTLSENAAIDCEEFLISYVNNDDIVPRLCLESLEHLRYDVVDTIARLKVPKNEVVCCFKRKHGHEDIKQVNERVLCAEEDIPDTEFKKQWKHFHELYQQRKEERDFPDVELFPPGKLVQIIPLQTKSSTSVLPRFGSRGSGATDGDDDKTQKFISRWATRLDFRDIRISSSCVSDHDGVVVLERCEHEAQRMNLKPPSFVCDTPVDSS